jgi:ankyrin repeat protein
MCHALRYARTLILLLFCLAGRSHCQLPRDPYLDQEMSDFEGRSRRFEELEKEQQQRAADEDRKWNFEQSIRLVVMVEGEIDGAPTVGAGIVFGRTKGGVSVVTANHVVRRGGRQARNLKLRFKDDPDTAIDASLSEHFDAAQDIAVLNVAIPAGASLKPCAWNFTRLSLDGPKRGDGVTAVGNPNGIGWAVPVKPDYISQINRDQIVFQTAFIATGDSGGALLTEDGHIAGMIQSDQPPYAAARSINAIAEQLWKWGYLVEFFATDGDAFTLLDRAAERGLDVIAGMILKACPAASNGPSWSGRTPLHFAAKQNQLVVLKMLIAAGGKPDGSNKQQGRPPLAVASFGGHLEAMKVLLDAGASLEAAGWDGTRASHVAAERGQMAALNLLLSKGADLNGTDNYGSTPLHYAARAGRVDAAGLLLDRGAKVSARDKNGLTPLDVSIQDHHAEFAKLLIHRGADVNSPTPQGVTPLLEAIQYSMVDVIETLLDAGAKVNNVDGNGRTPLSYAENQQIHRILQAHGAVLKP